MHKKCAGGLPNVESRPTKLTASSSETEMPKYVLIYLTCLYLVGRQTPLRRVILECMSAWGRLLNVLISRLFRIARHGSHSRLVAKAKVNAERHNLCSLVAMSSCNAIGRTKKENKTKRNTFVKNYYMPTRTHLSNTLTLFCLSLFRQCDKCCFAGLSTSPPDSLVVCVQEIW